MALSDKQRRILRGIVLALALTLIGIFVAPFVEALPRPADDWPADDFAARMRFALRWDLLLPICLFVNIGLVARHRFLTAEDMDGGGLTSGTDKVKRLQATLQNTLEQVTLAALIHLIWAATMPSRWLASLPIAAALFVLGRLAFWRGYRRGAPARAAGFGLTFYPSVVMALVLVVHAIVGFA